LLSNACTSVIFLYYYHSFPTPILYSSHFFIIQKYLFCPQKKRNYKLLSLVQRYLSWQLLAKLSNQHMRPSLAAFATAVKQAAKQQPVLEQAAATSRPTPRLQKQALELSDEAAARIKQLLEARNMVGGGVLYLHTCLRCSMGP
jgi:hypothetical protein